MQFLRAGNIDAAEAEYRRALKIDPATSDALHFLGMIAHQRGQSEQAIELMRRSIEVAPNVPGYHCNLGEVLRAIGRTDEAETHFITSIRLQPNHAQALNNLGMIALSRSQTEDAIKWFERAIQSRPDYARAHWNLSLVLLGLGEYARGWTEFEWRFRDPSLGIPPRLLRQPAWDGRDPAGRTILLHAEQGLGDTIQFVRYAPLLAQRGATVIVEVQPELKSLVQTAPGIAQVVARGEALPAFDAHASLMSLPRLFGTTIETIPANAPYLHIDAVKSAFWKTRLSSRTAAKHVGLVWAGRPQHWNDKARSVALQTLKPILETPGVQFVSLQTGEPASQLSQSALIGRVLDAAGELHDFTDTAALVDNLDLLISVDTSVVHLAGALNKPTWVLIPTVPDWRWHHDREDSPWYPSIRLFRQTRTGDWNDVVVRLATALAEFANG